MNPEPAEPEAPDLRSDEPQATQAVVADRRRSNQLVVVMLGLAAVMAGAFAVNAAGAGFLGLDFEADLPDAIATYCPGPDACSYLETGDEVLRTGFISPERYWVLNVWPPGVSIYGALIVAGSKLGLSLPAVAGILNIALWTGVLTAWWNLLNRKAGAWWATGAVLAVALGQPMRGWYLGNGLFYAESAATVSLLIALLFLASASEPARLGSDSGPDHHLRTYVAAGVFLAGAAYLRSPFEVAGQVLTLMAAGATFAALIANRRRIRSVSQAWHSISRVWPILAIVAAFHLMTIPWRIFAAWKLRPGDYRWTQASDLGWNSIWLPTAYLEEIGAGWLIGSTRNTACLVDEVRCAEIFDAEIVTDLPYNGTGLSTDEFQSEAISTLAQNPLQWLWVKVEAFPSFWFAHPRSVDQFEFLENGLLLAGLVLVLLIGVRRLTIEMYALVVAVTAATFGPIFLFHYEARYFYPLKSTLPILVVLLACALFNRRRSSTIEHDKPLDGPGPLHVPGPPELSGDHEAVGLLL